jgi:Protein of unknown function (DUF2934)
VTKEVAMAKSTKRQEDQRTVVHIFPNRGAQVRKEPTRLDIERRAYEIYLVRGGADGHAVDDWLQAEKELLDLPAEIQ